MHPLQINARLVEGAVYSKGPKQVACFLEWHGWILKSQGFFGGPTYWLEEFVIIFWVWSYVCWKRVGSSGETRKKLLPRMSSLCSRGVCLRPARVSKMSRGASYVANPKCIGHRTIFLSKKIDRSGMLDIDAHDSVMEHVENVFWNMPETGTFTCKLTAILDLARGGSCPC